MALTITVVCAAQLKAHRSDSDITLAGVIYESRYDDGEWRSPQSAVTIVSSTIVSSIRWSHRCRRCR